MNSSVEIRSWFSDSDPADCLLSMMRQSHGHEIDPEWLSTKLAWGLGGIGAVAFDSAKPVGLVLFGGAPYEYEGRDINVMLSYDTFVDGDYRGQGLFTRLLDAAEQACQARGVDLLLNFPNDASRPGFEKAGWQPLEPMRSFVSLSRRGGSRSVLSRAKGAAQSRRASFEPSMTGPLAAHLVNEFSNLVRDAEGLQFSLSAASLRYRFNERRGQGYAGTIIGDAGAIFRIGTRGSIRELQLMVTAPHHTSAKESRRLLQALAKRYDFDLISDLRPVSSANPLHRITEGYLGLTLVTTPYFKAFNPEVELKEPPLSGIDIHTW